MSEEFQKYYGEVRFSGLDVFYPTGRERNAKYALSCNHLERPRSLICDECLDRVVGLRTQLLRATIKNLQEEIVLNKTRALEQLETHVHRREEEIHGLQEAKRHLEQDVDSLQSAAGQEAAYRNRLREERDAERKRYNFLLRERDARNYFIEKVRTDRGLPKTEAEEIQALKGTVKELEARIERQTSTIKTYTDAVKRREEEYVSNVKKARQACADRAKNAILDMPILEKTDEVPKATFESLSKMINEGWRRKAEEEIAAIEAFLEYTKKEN